MKFNEFAPYSLRVLFLGIVILTISCALPGARSGKSAAERADPSQADAGLEPWDEATNLGPSIAGPAINDESLQRQRWSQLSREGRQALILGQIPQAEQHFLGALEVAKTFRRNDVRLKVTLAQLERVARRHHEDGQQEGFIRVAEIVAAKAQGLSDIDHPSLSKLLVDIARVQLERGEFEKSEAALNEALAARMMKEGENALSLEEIYGMLAESSLKLEKYEPALTYVERRVEMAQFLNTADDRRLSSAEYQHAQILIENGRMIEADSAFRRALDNEVELAPESIDEAMIRNALADLQVKLGNDQGALLMVTQSLAILAAQSVEGEVLGSVLDTKAQALAGIGKSAEAEKNYERALELLAEAPKDQRVTVLENYETFLLNQDRHSDATAIRTRIDGLQTSKPETSDEAPQHLSAATPGEVPTEVDPQAEPVPIAADETKDDALEKTTEETTEVAPSNIVNPTAETPEWDRGVSDLVEPPAS